MLFIGLNFQKSYSKEGQVQESFLNDKGEFQQITGDIDLNAAFKREIRSDVKMKLDIPIENGGLKHVSILIKSLMVLFPDLVDFKIEKKEPFLLLGFFPFGEKAYYLHFKMSGNSLMEGRPKAKEMMENLFIKNFRLVTFQEDGGQSKLKNSDGTKSYFYFLPTDFIIYQSAYHISSSTHIYYDEPLEGAYARIVQDSPDYFLSLLHELCHLERAITGEMIYDPDRVLEDEELTQERANNLILEFLNFHGMHPFRYGHGHISNS